MSAYIAEPSKPLRIAHVISQSEVVLNAGRLDGISMEDEFIIYGLSEDEIIDPSTKKSLGHLELYRGTGTVTYLQDTMCILSAISTNAFSHLGMLTTNSPATFNNPKVGDFAKPNATKI